jgi:hypothetical protein
MCPEFLGVQAAIHWTVPDPAREPGSDDDTLLAFERTARAVHADQFSHHAIERNNAAPEV